MAVAGMALDAGDVDMEGDEDGEASEDADEDEDEDGVAGMANEDEDEDGPGRLAAARSAPVSHVVGSSRHLYSASLSIRLSARFLSLFLCLSLCLCLPVGRVSPFVFYFLDVPHPIC